MRLLSDTVLRVEGLTVEYRGRHGEGSVKAVSDVSLDVAAGETLGLVGESGCGKSTLARAILQMPAPSAGSVYLHGTDMTTLRGRALRKMRPRVQIIFQDPISSLNPRRTIADIVAEPAVVWKRARGATLRKLVDDALEAVGLDPATTRDRRPTQFSGGQCQRVCIARALILDPDVIVCDEAVSALDVSIQAQILNLLTDLRQTRDLTLLFISHNLAVVKNVSDRVAVMYLGKLCEIGDAEDLYQRSAHPYTRALIDAIPSPARGARRRRFALVGDLPSVADPPSGCRFRTRCPQAQDICATAEPPIRAVADGHFVACHFPLPGLKSKPA